MTRCLRDSTGGNECRAITISTSADKASELRTDKVGDEEFSTNTTSTWQSFCRPVWYVGR